MSSCSVATAKPVISRRRSAPSDEPDGDADRGQHQDLQQIDAEDQARPGAPRHFSVAMVARLALEIAAHRIADADAADQQRGQPDQGQEQSRCGR